MKTKPTRCPALPSGSSFSGMVSKMNKNSLDSSSFVIHSNDEIQGTDIQVDSHGLAAILETDLSLNDENDTTISDMKKTVSAVEWEMLDYFGPNEILFDYNPPTRSNELINSKKSKYDKVKILHKQDVSLFKIISEEPIQEVKVYDSIGRLLFKNYNNDDTSYSFSGYNFLKGVLCIFRPSTLPSSKT